MGPGADGFHAFLAGVGNGHEQVRGYAFFPPRGGAFDDQPVPPFDDVLAALGVRPYRHQAAALRSVASGRHVVVATGTASGKSLVFQAPALHAAREGGSAILVFPTKALAADQEARLRAGAVALGLDPGLVARYDGDLGREARAQARARARLVITNPDMLHYGILPFAAQWQAQLASLRLLVIDEVHAYRGVMGVHVANIVRRALRLAAAMGATPTVVAASATIGNPAEHLTRITSRSAEAIAADDAPRGPREFVVWRPAALPGRHGGTAAAGSSAGPRRSANTEAATVGAALVRSGVKTLVFCNSRRGAELVRRYLVQSLPPELGQAVLTYRGGYTAEDRERIAALFREGEAVALVTTSALELGVDVGDVDAVVLVGYPGSTSALWQRAGRAGRGVARSLTLWIPAADPLDEYYLHHPELLIDGRPEDAVADPWNDELHPAHLVCAAAERPLRQGEPLVAPWTEVGRVPGLVRVADDPVDGAPRYGSARRYPHRAVRVRGAVGPGPVRLRDADGRTLGRVDGASALRDLHPGAVYLHQGEAFVSVRLDLERGEATLVPHLEDYYTQPRSETDVTVIEAWPRGRRPGRGAATMPEVRSEPPPGVSVGRVRVSTLMTGYVRKRYHADGALDERPLDLPPVTFDTQACWFELGRASEALPPDRVPGAIHALEHTLIGLLPAFVLCERADVGGVSYPMAPDSGRPTVFIYDGYPGGVGYAAAGASVFRDWLDAARDLLARCGCEQGCPRCVLSPKCGNGNQMLDKRAALTLATVMLARLTPEAA